MKKGMLIGVVGLLLAACNSNPNGYRIQGNVANAGNGIAVLGSSAGRGEAMVWDTVSMKKGVFVFRGTLEAPALMAIQIIPQGEEPANVSLFAENKPIRITADWDNVFDWHGYRSIREVKVEGSRNHDVNELLSGVYDELKGKPEFKAYAEVEERLGKLRETDRAAYEKLKEESEELTERFRAAVRSRQLQLIRENRDVESVARTLQFLMGGMSLKELEEVFNSLAPNVQENPMAADVRKEIAALQRVQPGQPAPDIKKEDMNGKIVAISDLRGKYVLVDFWASWCVPCRKSFPHVKALYKKYHAKGFEVFCVADNDSTEDAWRKAIKDDGVGMFYHVLRGLRSYRDENGRHCFDRSNDVSDLYAVHSLPTKYLIDPQGNIVGKFDDAELDRKLAEIFSTRK